MTSLLKNKASQQVLQIFSANMIKAAIGFLGSMIVLRGWSVQDIGDIYTLVGVFLICNQLGDLGTGSSFIKLASGRKKIANNLTISFLSFKHLIVFILLLGAALFFSLYFFHKEIREFYGLGVILLAASFQIYSGFFSILLQSQQRFKEVSFLKILPVSAKVLMLAILLYWPTRNFSLLLVAFMLPSLVSFVLGRIFTGYALLQGHIKSLVDQHGRILFDLSKWVFFITLTQTLFSQLDIFMLKRMSNDYQVSQFVGAQKLGTAILIISQAVFTVMLPKMTSYKTSIELLRFNKKIFYGYLVGLVTLTPAIFLAPHLLPLFFGGRYGGSVPIFQVFIFQALGYMFINNQALLFYRKDKLKTYAFIVVIQFFLNFLGNYLVIYDSKALGVVWVSTLLNNFTFFFMSIYCYLLFKRELKAPN